MLNRFISHKTDTRKVLKFLLEVNLYQVPCQSKLIPISFMLPIWVKAEHTSTVEAPSCLSNTLDSRKASNPKNKYFFFVNIILMYKIIFINSPSEPYFSIKPVRYGEHLVF